MCVGRHAQITQNKMSAIFLQYLKKQVNDDVDLLHAGKHENVLQIDTMIWMGMVKHFQSFQNSKFAISLQYLKNEVRDEFDFLHANKQSDLQVHFNTLGTKFSYKVILSLLMNMIKHSQSTQSNKCANLRDISKKKSEMVLIFCMQIFFLQSF